MRHVNWQLAGSVCWHASGLPNAAQEVRHARTRVGGRMMHGEPGFSGSTRWEGRSADAVAWIEWDWVENGHGLVVQADPLSVRSNVLLLDERCRPLLSSRRRATLATLVYLLPWHGPVFDELRRRGIGRSLVRHSRQSAACTLPADH